MAEKTPVIIEVALNGPTTKDKNPHVPRTPDEIVSDALACIDAGAAIVHNHNDDQVLGTKDGVHSPEPYIQAWTQILAKHKDAILYPTKAGGGHNTTIENRYAHVLVLAEAGILGMALFDPGSADFATLGDEGLPIPVDDAYINTSADIRYMFDHCKRLRLPLSISIFEPGWLRVALSYHDARSLPEGTIIKLYMGGNRMCANLPPTEPSLNAYLSILAKYDLPWLVSIPGGDVLGSGLAKLALERGGHVRVGIEDYDGPRTPTNAELVREAVDIARSLGRAPATCTQARQILGFPRSS